MALTRPKGQSKREAAAAKAGGSLNYKTGKISVPVKTPTVKTARSSAVDISGEGPMTNAQYESNIASGLGPVSSVNAAKAASPSNNKSNNKPFTRQVAATPITTGTDYNKVSLTPTTSRDTGSFGSQLLRGATNVAKSIVPGGQAIGDLLQSRGVDISGLLGIDKALASNTGLASYTNDNGQVLGVQDQQNMYDYNNQPQGSQPITDANQFIANANQQRANQNIFDTKGFAAASAQQNAASGRTPRQTTNQPTQSTNISLPELLQAVVSHPDFQAQDNNPVSQGQSGTVRQLPGNGAFSNGQYNNGQGDYGFQGTSTGTSGGSNPLDELATILGLKPMTAQAAEMPNQMGMNSTDMSQQSFDPTSSWNFSLPSSGGSAQMLGNDFSGFGNMLADANNQGNQNRVNQQIANTPKPQVGNGGVTQQFSQGATGGNSSASPMMDYQKQSLKGFSAQEKAQKKALDELIKSIKNQYSTSQTTGINDLNTAKQQDLLKLSGLFSFANQDPNSEQRVQYEQRANQDYAKQQADFIAKLAAAQQGDISQANQGYQGKLADINSQRNTAQYNIANLLQQAQNDAANRASKGSASAKVPGVNTAWAPYQIQNFANNMISQGHNWQDIADTARANAIDVSQGSTFDNFMRNYNGLQPVKNTSLQDQILMGLSGAFANQGQ